MQAADTALVLRPDRSAPQLLLSVKGVVNSLSFEAEACHMFAQNGRARG